MTLSNLSRSFKFVYDVLKMVFDPSPILISLFIAILLFCNGYQYFILSSKITSLTKLEGITLCLTIKTIFQFKVKLIIIILTQFSQIVSNSSKRKSAMNFPKLNLKIRRKLEKSSSYNLKSSNIDTTLMWQTKNW